LSQSSSQVIGNVSFGHHLYPSCVPSFLVKIEKEKDGGLQFQEREVGVAVVCAVFALLGDIVLEDGGGFGIVSVEAVQDVFDVAGPLGGVVECYTHGCGLSIILHGILRSRLDV
jgi:hypothetical protein